MTTTPTMTAEQALKEIETLVIRQIAGHIGSQQVELDGVAFIHQYAAEREAAMRERCAEYVETHHIVPGINPPSWIICEGAVPWNKKFARAIRSLKGGVG